jgi:hypothetical protein
VALSQAGIATDILGAGRENLPSGLADSVHALLPRADLAYALSDAVLAQAKDKLQKAEPLTFPGELLRHHLPYGTYPGWYDLLASAGWGDKPIDPASRRRAESPEQVATLFMEYLDAGDLDGLVSLYEPHAHFVPTPATHLVGTTAIRAALRQMIDSGAHLKLELRDAGSTTSPWSRTPPPSPEPRRTAAQSFPPPQRSSGVSPTAAGPTSSTTPSSADHTALGSATTLGTAARLQLAPQAVS